jgi:hypothetical protein
MIAPWFERDPTAFAALQALLLARYGTLRTGIEEGVAVLQGSYGIVHDGHEIDRYQLRIALPADYPNDLPIVWETGGRIPRDDIDRHVFPTNGALCVGVPVALWITLGGNFSIDRFLDSPVRTYLIGNGLVEAGQPWPHGHWSHGVNGLLEFYRDHLGITDPVALLQFLASLLDNRVRGHWSCPCGSATIIRKCHSTSVADLRALPKEILHWSFKAILDHLQKKSASVGRLRHLRGGDGPTFGHL